jgi:hypothetical protein
VIIFARGVLVDGRAPSLLGHLLLFGEAAAVMAIGSIIYSRHAPRVAEAL